MPSWATNRNKVGGHQHHASARRCLPPPTEGSLGRSRPVPASFSRSTATPEIAGTSPSVRSTRSGRTTRHKPTPGTASTTSSLIPRATGRPGWRSSSESLLSTVATGRSRVWTPSRRRTPSALASERLLPHPARRWNGQRNCPICTREPGCSLLSPPGASEPEGVALRNVSAASVASRRPAPENLERHGSLAATRWASTDGEARSTSSRTSSGGWRYAGQRHGVRSP